MGHISLEKPCGRVKPRIQGRAPLRQSPVGAVMDRLALDIMGPLPPQLEGHLYIVVWADYFTKWEDAYASKDQIAQTVTELLVS